MYSLLFLIPTPPHTQSHTPHRCILTPWLYWVFPRLSWMKSNQTWRTCWDSSVEMCTTTWLAGTGVWPVYPLETPPSTWRQWWGSSRYTAFSKALCRVMLIKLCSTSSCLYFMIHWYTACIGEWERSRDKLMYYVVQNTVCTSLLSDMELCFLLFLYSLPEPWSWARCHSGKDQGQCTKVLNVGQVQGMSITFRPVQTLYTYMKVFKVVADLGKAFFIHSST